MIRPHSAIPWILPALLILAVSPPSFAQSIHYVDQSATGAANGETWGDAFITVTEAIDDATAGDEIWVARGTYNESIQMVGGVALFGGFLGSESQRVERNWATNSTIIDATGNKYFSAITVDKVEETTIDGFTITGGHQSPFANLSRGGGVRYEEVSSATLVNCNIKNNFALVGAGIYCFQSNPFVKNCKITENFGGDGLRLALSNPMIEDCTISNHQSGGVRCASTIATFLHCSISGNMSEEIGGVGCYHSNVEFVHCTITGNRGLGVSSGIYCSESNVFVSHCILWNPGNEILLIEESSSNVTYSCVQGGYDGEGNINSYPSFVDPSSGDWRLANNSPCIDRGQKTGGHFNGEARDLGSWEAPGSYRQGPLSQSPKNLFVNPSSEQGGDGTSWESGFHSLSDALRICTTTHEIWVTEGIYRESINLENNVLVFGGFSGKESRRAEREPNTHATVIDVSGTNSRPVTVIGGEGIVLDGFTLTGGHFGKGGGVYLSHVQAATFSSCKVVANTAADGGGIYCYQSSPHILNCTVAANHATSSGGGGNFDTSEPTIMSCLFNGNSAASGGGLYNKSTHMRIFETVFSQNTGQTGGGMYDGTGALTLQDCKIEHNYAFDFGGGMYLINSKLRMVNSSVSNNNAQTTRGITSHLREGKGGGIHISNGTPELIGTLISRNTAPVGGAFYFNSTNGDLLNCTVAGNRALERGSGVFCENSSPTFTNCISWNPGNEMTAIRSSTPTVQYSCFQGGISGEKNINAYPRFVNPNSADYRLQNNSPCIDRGKILGVRYNGKTMDIGYWESPGSYSQGEPNHSPLHLHVRQGAGSGGDGSTWGNAFRTILHALTVCSVSDEIWVAGGEYEESLLLESGVKLLGGFGGTESAADQRDWVSNPTVLNCERLGRRVVTIQSLEGVSLDGFAITGGTAQRGGGIFICDVLSVSIRNCTLHDNSASQGGGIYSGDWSRECASTPVIAACTIFDNSAESGGGFYCQNGHQTIRSSRIIQNLAHGNGGGIYCAESSSADVSNSFLEGNVAYNEGGAIFCGQFSSVIVNNLTFVDNWDRRGGAVVDFYSGLNLKNSIFSGGGIFSYAGSQPELSYNCYEFLSGEEEGSLGGDPLFVDPDNGNYRLQLSSPCIDAGNPDPRYNDTCLPPGQGSIRNDMGYTGGVWNCDVLQNEPIPTLTPTSTPTPTPPPPCDSGYYILDSYGGRHRVGNPTIITGSLYFGRDIARDLERATVQIGQATDTDLVVLDGAGVAHFVEYPDLSIPQMFYFGEELEEFPQGRAVDLVMSKDSLGLWVLTDFGGIYRAGSSLDGGPVRVPNSDRFGLGWDVPIGPEMRAAGLEAPGGATLRAVSLVVIDEDENNIADGYVILDSMGGHHQIDNNGEDIEPGFSMGLPENSPQRLLDPAAYVWPFFKGLDIARDAELHPTEEGVVLFDGWGGIHPVPVDQPSNPVFFANNRDPNDPSEMITTVGMPYITAGFPPTTLKGEEAIAIDAASIFADLEFSAGCGNGFYTLDKFGGVFAFGAARSEPDNLMPPFSGSPYFYPDQLAVALEVFAGDETGFETDFRDIITVDIPNLPEGARPMRLVRIPAGSFQMGSPETERGRSNYGEGPVHTVTITNDFYIGETEVTQAQWRSIMGTIPAELDSGVGDNYPIYNISWININASNGFLDRLESQTSCNGFRLPSEAEWEYACRAGTQSRFSFGDNHTCDDQCGSCALADQYMWWCGNSTSRTSQPVGSKLSNAFKLFDMHGNVNEWCQDWWQVDFYNQPGATRDNPLCTNPTSGVLVVRGGDWYNHMGLCRSSARRGVYPDARNYSIGFRVVLPVSP